MNENTATENQQQNSEQPTPPCCSASSSITGALSKAKTIILNPQSIWSSLKAEQGSIGEVYRQYILILAAIAPICGFLGMTIFGITIPFAGTVRTPVVSGLVYAIAQYIMSLAMVYIAAVIIEFLAPKFGGQTNRATALRLIAYSLAASYLAGFLSLIPVLGIIGGILSLYSLYLYFQGIPAMTGVGEGAGRWKLFIVSIIGIFIAGIILSVIIGIVAPHPATYAATDSVMNQGNMEQFQKTMEQFQKGMEGIAANAQ